MKNRIATLVGIVMGFLTLTLLAHLAGVEMEKRDVIILVSGLLTFISLFLLTTGNKTDKPCRENLKA